MQFWFPVIYSIFVFFFLISTMDIIFRTVPKILPRIPQQISLISVSRKFHVSTADPPTQYLEVSSITEVPRYICLEVTFFFNVPKLFYKN